MQDEGNVIGWWICHCLLSACPVQELLVEQLVERAYHKMRAEGREAISYDDVGRHWPSAMDKTFIKEIF